MQTNTLVIRAVEKTEVLKLQKIGKSTFAETFIDDCTPSDMEKYLEEKHSLELIRYELENPESQFFFAEVEGQIVGYLKINQGKAQTELKLENALEIERLYVLLAFQGKKIGQVLIDKVMHIARSEQFKYVWLGVWEHNNKAIRFYKKNGFVVFDSHPFIVGTDHQTDLLMKLEL